jgi:hypothetical protein
LVSSTSPTFPCMICMYNIASIYLYWVYIPHMRENMRPLAFWTWLTSLKMMLSGSIHLPADNKISSFFMAE